MLRQPAQKREKLGRLSSQSRNKRFQDCGKQKGKHEIRSNSAGRVIFPNFRHCASQGLSLGTSSPTDPRCGIIHGEGPGENVTEASVGASPPA